MNGYNRGGFLNALPAVTRFVLIINVLIFIVNMFIPRNLEHYTLIDIYFSLYSIHPHPQLPFHFQPYQLITHMFHHANFSHLFFNMFGLFMFGRVLETVIGSKKFFMLYFLSGLGAAALQLSVYYFQNSAAMMIGASGAIFGILAAFAVLFPNVELMIIFIPIPIKAKYLLPVYALLTLIFGIAGFSWDNIAHFAHLGGGIVGFILVMIWKRNRFKIY